MATAFAGRIITTANSWTDIFATAGISASGMYEVTILVSGAATVLTTDNTSTTGLDLTSSVITGSGVGTGHGLKFTWDASIPLYFYRSGTNGTEDLILSPVPSVGLSVSC